MIFDNLYRNIFRDNYFLKSRVVQFLRQRKEDLVSINIMCEKKSLENLLKILDNAVSTSFLGKCVRILVSISGLPQNPRVCFSYHFSLEEKY